MEHYSTKKRFCPHLIETKIKAVELFRQTHDVEYVMRKYHGMCEPLENKSHKPKTQHSNAHTEQKLKATPHNGVKNRRPK